MTNRFTRNLKDPETGRWSGREIWYRVRGALAVLLSVGILGGGGYYVYTQASGLWTMIETSDDYEATTSDQDVEVDIPQGSSLTSIGLLLVKADVIKSTNPFTKATAAKGEGYQLDWGKFRLKKHISAAAALEMLEDGKNKIRNTFMLIEGKWLSELVATMSVKMNIPVEAFDALLTNPDPAKIGLPAWFKQGSKTAEGFIFPDTYEIPEVPDALGLIKMTTTRFNDVATQLDLEARAKVISEAEGLTISAYDLVTIASIIEREVNRDEDRPKVARVIYNRLKVGEILGMDSTVAYAVKKQIYSLTQADLDTDSPYNTRKYKGLPPTPIANPGKAALQAAANPADGGWMYFVVTDPLNKVTEFAVTTAEFNQLQAKYAAWCNQSEEHKKVCA